MRKSVALVSGVVLIAFVSTALAEVRARRKFNCDDKGDKRRYSYCIEGASADTPARGEYQRPYMPYDQLYAPPPPGSGPAPEGSGSAAGGNGGGGGGGGK